MPDGGAAIVAVVAPFAVFGTAWVLSDWYRGIRAYRRSDER